MSIHKWYRGLYITVEDWYKKGYIYINVIQPLTTLSPEDPWVVSQNPKCFREKSVLLVDDEKGRKLIEENLDSLANAIMREMETEFSRERTTVIKAEYVFSLE